MISDYFTALGELLGRVPSRFLSNMDEDSHADWPDAHPETVYVPIEFEADSVPIFASRTGKQITLIGCTCADGTFLKPLLIIPRHVVDADLKLFSISQANYEILHQPSSFIDREIFEHWVMKICVPGVTRRREKTRYEGPAVLILDGCTAHDEEAFWDLCMENSIIPHVQPCDLRVFGVTKRIITRLNRALKKTLQSLHMQNLSQHFILPAIRSTRSHHFEKQAPYHNRGRTELQ
jgi:hypothetical protein